MSGHFYNKYATRNPMVRLLVSGYLKSMERCLRKASFSSILEVGCGEGHVLQRLMWWFPDAQLHACDIDAHIIKRDEIKIPFLASDAASLPFHDDSYDMVILAQVLEHLPKPQNALAELARVSRRYALVTVPKEPLWRMMNIVRGAYLWRWGNTPGHINHYTPSSFHRLVSEYFNIIELCQPLPFIVSLMEKKKVPCDIGI